MRKTRLLALACCLVLIAGCGTGGFSGLYSLPLPGGADLGPRPYKVRAEFSDVLDLVPQAMVKVNDVPAGRVDRVELAPDNRKAIVTMEVNANIALPANATAKLRQSSLLGEKFVELGGPVGVRPAGKLTGGSVIPLSRTNRNAEVEEVLGALSLLLNNGGIQQVQSITKELNHALGGREPELRTTLSRVSELTSSLNAQRDNITRALDGMNTLSETVAKQRDQIAGGLNAMEPGLKSANQQRDQIVTMLGALHRLSGVATDTVNRSRDDLLADLHSLVPTLRQLAKSGGNIPKSMQMLLSYPFADYAMNALKGDYFNADFTLDFQFDHIIDMINRSSTPVIPPIRPDPDKPAAPPSGPQMPPPAGNQQRAVPEGQPPPSDASSGGQQAPPSAPSGQKPGLGGVFDSITGGGR